jgi:hypothetical protein
LDKEGLKLPIYYLVLGGVRVDEAGLEGGIYDLVMCMSF